MQQRMKGLVAVTETINILNTLFIGYFLSRRISSEPRKFMWNENFSIWAKMKIISILPEG